MADNTLLLYATVNTSYATVNSLNKIPLCTCYTKILRTNTHIYNYNYYPAGFQQY